MAAVPRRTPDPAPSLPGALGRARSPASAGMRAVAAAASARAAGAPAASHVRLSVMLERLAEQPPGERVPLGALIDRFGHRAFGALIALFAAPNVLPIPAPGLSLLFGIPLILLTVQLAAGRPKPWLPGLVRRRSLAADDLRRIVGRIRGPLARAERMIRPRLLPLTSWSGERLLGAFGAVLALTLFLPLPFGNALPGLGLVLIGLALLERDGAAALVGVAAGLAGIAVATGAATGFLLGGLALASGLR